MFEKLNEALLLPLIPEENAPIAESEEINNQVEVEEETPISEIERMYRECLINIDEEIPEDDISSEISSSEISSFL